MQTHRILRPRRSPPWTNAAVVLMLLLTGGFTARAELRLANIFNDYMVLQQENPVRVWGWAVPGGEVSVRFGDQTRSAKADDAGFWQVELAPLAATFDERELTVTSGEESVSVMHVLVGEVWLCSGQSNMVWSVTADTEWDLESESYDYPAVRYCEINPRSTTQPQEDLHRRPRWLPLKAGDKGIREVSGVAFYFAARLHRYLKVPVGIVHNAWGGTTGEAWTSRATLDSLPQLRELLAHWDRRIAGWPQERERRVAEYASKVEQARRDGNEPPRGPRLDDPAVNRNNPAGCYNAMILPIRRLAIRGVLFYQGENNAYGQWDVYRHSFPRMIDDWRAAFADQDLPFGIVSLAGLGPTAWDTEPELEMTPGGFYYAAILDIHLRTFRSKPNTGLITTFDLGDADYIHPARKMMVGQRSARWALARVYDKPVVHTGPIYREMERAGKKIKLQFDLDPLSDPKGAWWLSCPITRSGRYRGFVIAGEDRHFHPAQVRRLDKEHLLEVWSELVPEPVAVRYSWSNYPDGNVIGLKYLPAPPFRTDDWPLAQQQPYDPKARQEWDKKRAELRQAAKEQARKRKLADAKRVIERDGR